MQWEETAFSYFGPRQVFPIWQSFSLSMSFILSHFAPSALYFLPAQLCVMAMKNQSVPTHVCVLAESFYRTVELNSPPPPNQRI